MLALPTILLTSVLSLAGATPLTPAATVNYGCPALITTPPPQACGSVNIVFTGLPPYHPLVTAQGFNGSVVDAGLRKDAAEIVEAGYNLRVVLMGPEQPISVLEHEVTKNNTQWTGTGIGYGVRGGRSEKLTIRLEDILHTYRTFAPTAPTVFDYSFTSALWAVKRKFPLAEGCEGKGKDFGFEIFCDICK